TSAPKTVTRAPAQKPEEVSAPAQKTASKPPAKEAEPAVAASPPEEEIAAAPVASSSATVGLAHIKDAWPATMQELGKRSKRIQAFLNPSRPLEFDGDRLLVEVQSPFHESTMSEERHRATLADALHGSLGIRPSPRS
ncbi:MAG: hypothetical protein QOK47_650, partial [Actinomycetota bacterium]|nr:hypothetical protein [Actinomycetota bacterium]